MRDDHLVSADRPRGTSGSDTPSGPEASYPAIGDYAVIGNCRTAALVSRAGALDWLSLPRFDSPALFGALLDRRRGGAFQVCPTGRFAAARRYVEDTNVLQTTFTTDRGVVRLTDLMPVASEAEKRRELWPEHEVLRVIEGIAGEVEIGIRCDPRPHYGAVVPRLADRGLLGCWYEHGAEALVVRSEVPLATAPGQPGVHGRVRVRAGERRSLSLVYAHGEPAVLPALGVAADRRVRQTVRWWQAWIARGVLDGPHRAAVTRSVLALKLMTYAPSGAVIAAPTTSLPERVGGVRNWDYRYCWLRDGSLTVRAFLDLGYREEACAFISWMLHATRLTWPEIRVLYDVHGEVSLPERELDHLEGYGGSRPVRTGNGAADQLQLDVYGEVADAVSTFTDGGGELDRTTGGLLVALGRTVCRRWREPDDGIWEVRSGRRHHTHSKAMCWVALDRVIRLHEGGHLRAPVRALREFQRERDLIRAEVEARGYRADLGSYVSVLDGHELDASLLLLARYGYVEPTSPRMVGTCARIHERLGTNGLLYRYLDEDGLPPGEGAFGIAGFWGVDCRVRQGDVAGAEAVFAHLCRLGNDLGLFAEEIEPATGAPLGNFPQAFTHVGLIDAALTLAAATGHRPARGPGRLRAGDVARAR
jgi:GH15 family glucan-1,4-alpha-glucosidase